MSNQVRDRGLVVIGKKDVLVYVQASLRALDSSSGSAKLQATHSGAQKMLWALASLRQMGVKVEGLEYLPQVTLHGKDDAGAETTYQADLLQANLRR